MALYFDYPICLCVSEGDVLRLEHVDVVAAAARHRGGAGGHVSPGPRLQGRHAGVWRRRQSGEIQRRFRGAVLNTANDSHALNRFTCSDCTDHS